MKLDAFLDQLRPLCHALPESEEYVMVHHPAFRAGKKMYAVVGEAGGNVANIAVKVPLMEQALYTHDPRFKISPYIGQHGWVTLDLSGGIHWDEIRRLVTESYRRVALKRMLAKLDAAR